MHCVRSPLIFPPVNCQLKRIALATLLSGSISCASLSFAQQASGTPTYPVELASQPLGQALARLRAQTGLQIDGPPGPAAEKNAPAVQGTLEAQEALRQLLAGSGLIAVQTGARSFALQPTPAPAPSGAKIPPATERSLQPVTVTSFEPANYTVPVAGFGALGEKTVADTPISITSFSRDLLERQQAVKLSEVLRNDPSITSVPTAGSFAANFVGIRGYVGGADGFTFDGMGPGVPLFVLQGTLEATERFELIKGPASSLYGFSPFASIGGHINLIPKKPLPAPLTTVTVGLREKSAARVAGDISRRFGADEQFGLRINAVTESGKPNVSQANDDRKVLTFAGDWKVSRDVSLEAGYNYYKVRNDAPQTGFSLEPGVAVPDTPDARTNFYQSWNYLQTELKLATLGATWRFAPDWKVSVKTLSGTRASSGIATPGGTIFNAQGDFEYPALFIPPAGQYDFSSYQLAVAGQVRVGGIQHDLALAVNQDKWTIDQGRAPIGFFESNLYAPRYVAQPALPGNLPIRRTNDSSSRGVFLSDSITVNDQWSGLIALRQSDIRYRNFDASGGVELDQADRKTSPLLGLMFKPQPAISLYANYAEGLQRGGQAPSTAVNADQILPSVKTSQREFGIKYETPDGLSLAAAYFDISKPLEYLDSDNRFVQAGKQNHKGFEFTAAGNITRRLAVVGGLLLLNPRQKGTGDPATEGKIALGVPRINIPVYATYDIAQVPGLTLSAGLQHFGKQYVDDANTVELKAWTRYDAGLRYASKLLGKQTTFSLNIENINNRRYFASASEGQLALGAPRTVRASLSTEF